MDESEFVPISALQHYVFCPRQCALIHLERLWQENVHTAEGRIMHEAAHTESSRRRGEVRIATALSLRSMALGVFGQADVVEFYREEHIWRPYPVEYKKGHVHKDMDADMVQLCAQALCLEEMLDRTVSEGALFYGEPRRRTRVEFSGELRERTRDVAKAVHELFVCGLTPVPDRLLLDSGKCRSCSLLDWCLPDSAMSSASRYLERLRRGVE